MNNNQTNSQINNQVINPQVNSNIPSSQPLKTPKKEKTFKQKLRNFFIFLIFIGLIVVGVSIYLLIDDNNKYNTYTATAADLISSEKIYKRGISYYQGTYKYIIKKKEYFYKSPQLYQNQANKIIQIKYDSKNPNKIYNEESSKYYFIILFSGLGFSFISLIIAISLSSSKLNEIITVQVIEQVTCVGGRRVYLNNINIRPDDPEAINTKYYVYFTNDLKKFAVGNKLTFNMYKYNEVFTTEQYRTCNARVIYNFQNEDFTLVEEMKVNINKTY